MRRNPPDAVSLDDIARDLAPGTSRRQLLRVLVAGVAAGLLSLHATAAALADRRCREPNGD
jgi:hydroxymethylglutaryl-CoA reductase